MNVILKIAQDQSQILTQNNRSHSDVKLQGYVNHSSTNSLAKVTEISTPKIILLRVSLKHETWVCIQLKGANDST